MDYHNEIIKEKDVEIKKLVAAIKELESEIQRLKRVVKQGLVCEEEKAKRITYLENVLTYLESRVGI